ncbi:MAG: bifunctional methylenetetrahydrofolate dehydrogenase/methenyltetrahydrofolate cyclohydrolase FolD [Myxococcaceae bacterium]|jgi:methylenetetrahydrofolate dehydrogenase (NADP+)/methenyltetrahydrofolate cyclohydrolase|nr:bifunctional methylenetetrahydrofolate dehydrogenase/methenyltetrahydrofolate cyclohydrolase FolD [Myxococcaceae bacterium]
MTAQLIDGKALAAKVRDEVKHEAAAVVARYGRAPGIAVVRVGDDPASQVYVTSKEKTARELGFGSWHHHFPATMTQAELLAVVARLNAEPLVDGILVQLPLPRHLDANAVLAAIDPSKDVDGFHATNAGLLFQGRPGLVPCTPAGCMRMLQELRYDVTGRRCVVIGRSTIVGRPMAMLLLNASATVTICHSKSDVAAEVQRADVVVAAVGVSRLVKGDWVKPGAVVIDVGMNRGPDGKLSGDVDFEAAKERAAFITPVPGGVGPMTIAMLMHNTVVAAKARLSR